MVEIAGFEAQSASTTEVGTKSPAHALRFLAPPLKSRIMPLPEGYPDNALESDSELCLA